MALLEKALQIKEEKEEKVLPENIRAGVTILGVTGEYGEPAEGGNE